MEAQNSETLASDWQLLRDYVERSSQTAFATLVERHVNFVYSTCLREVRDATLAEDITQVVFLILARKAAGLRETGTLSGWLYKTSCFASKNAMKQERNRQRQEQSLMSEIMAEDQNSAHSNQDWSRLEELLHDALSQLNNEQRDVILLRFFEGKSVRATGEALGITEKAAERRLARALEKMRHYFQSCGYTVSAVALGALLTENAVQAAPAACVASALELAGSVTAGGAVTTAATGAASGAASGALTSAQVVSLSQGVLKAMLISQIKTGVVASLGFSLMTASTVKIAHYAMAAQQKTAPLASIRRTSPQKPLMPPILRASTTKIMAPAIKSAEKAPLNSLAIAQKRAPRLLLAQPTLPLSKPEDKALPAEEIKQEIKKESPKNVVPAKVTRVADIMPQAGEIAVEGPLIAINNGRLIIDVTSYTIPGDKTNLVNPAKPKAILLSPQTLLHVRGSNTPIKWNELNPEVLIRAVGTDKGTGEPLPARDIAVWDSVTNGIYGWQGATAPELKAPPGDMVETPIAAAIEIGEDADVPPDAEKRPYENQFPQGDFQRIANGQPLAGWLATANLKARLQEKNGARWLALTNETPNNWGTVRYILPLQPDWKRLRVAAQLKVKNLQQGAEWWNTSRLDFNFYDDKNRVVGYGRGLNLYKNTGWTLLDKIIRVPEGATKLVLEPGLFNTTGELLVDNIRVEANVPFTGRAIRPGFPEGTFENIITPGWPEGFEPWTPHSFNIVEENGNHFLRLINEKPDSSMGGEGWFQLPPGWTAFRLRAKMRARNLKIGDKTWESGRVTLMTVNAEGERAGGYLDIVQLREDSDWKTLEVVNPIAKDATVLQVQPGLIGSTGILDIDDIEIVDASHEDLPHLPILEKGPSTTFDELNGRGWPMGWIGDGRNPDVVSTVEEEGNRFLRLSSDKLIYQAAKGRYKLPATWRAIRVIARLRMKNLKRKPGAQGWETARVGFIFQNKQGERAGGFQQSLEMSSDSDWKQLSVKADIPRDAVYIEMAAILQEASGIFDVDDLQFEQAQPTVKIAPIYEWTRAFPEGTFENQDENGDPLHWEMHNRAQILQEDGNKFLRLTGENARDTIFVSGQWKIKPEWKGVRVRARLRGANLKKGANPLDGARLRILFMDAGDNPLAAMPEPLELKKDTDWIDLQTQAAIPPGAASIKLMPSLSRTSGLLDVDDVMIEPLLN